MLWTPRPLFRVFVKASSVVKDTKVQAPFLCSIISSLHFVLGIPRRKNCPRTSNRSLTALKTEESETFAAFVFLTRRGGGIRYEDVIAKLSIFPVKKLIWKPRVYEQSRGSSIWQVLAIYKLQAS